MRYARKLVLTVIEGLRTSRLLSGAAGSSRVSLGHGSFSRRSSSASFVGAKDQAERTLARVWVIVEERGLRSPTLAVRSREDGLEDFHLNFRSIEDADIVTSELQIARDARGLADPAHGSISWARHFSKTPNWSELRDAPTLALIGAFLIALGLVMIPGDQLGDVLSLLVK
jgi:hypothetical protein